MAAIVALVGVSITGLHHIPSEQVITPERASYRWSISQAARAKTCTAYDETQVEAGHCWFNPREQEWYWCRPKIVNRVTEKFLTDLAVEQDFDRLITDSSLGIVGSKLVMAAEGRCVHYEGKDVYR